MTSHYLLALLVCVVSGWAADQVTLAQAREWLAKTPVWLGLIALQALLAYLRWPGPTPVHALLAFGVCGGALLTPWFANGLVAGAVWGALWVGLLALASRLAWTRRFPIAAHLPILILVPATTEMNSLHDLLYVISNAFLAPTLIGTLVAFGYGIWVVARGLADYGEHRENMARIDRFLREDASLIRFAELRLRGDWLTLQKAVDSQDSAQIGLTLASIENGMHARLDRLGILSKVGPMLGLIGTLIPLQPALAGLAKGDIQAMGANLQIGFTTTVLGLITGGACYAVSVFRKAWYEREMTAMEFLVDQWFGETAARELERSTRA